MLQRWVDCDGLLVHTVEWSAAHARGSEPGSGEDVEPLLLVHGLGGSTVSWELVGGELADRLGTTVTAVDLPGFGRTRPEGRPASFPTHLALLTAYLDRAGPAVVVGNSMGGALGIALAASRPELVDGLVLVNAAFPRPRANLEQLARSMRFAALMFPRAVTPIVRRRANVLGAEGLGDSTLAVVLAEPAALDPALRDRLVALARERGGYPEVAPAYAQSGGTLFRYLAGPMRRDIGAVHCPTMMVHGRRDQLVPVTFARAVAHRRPDWLYEELGRCGHAPQLEQPDRLVTLVGDWLDPLARRPRAAPGRATPA
jgi:pimeloyl-ACP methyl ester carboxylesterase